MNANPPGVNPGTHTGDDAMLDATTVMPDTSGMAITKRLSVAPIKRLALEAGARNASQLASSAGLTRTTAYRYWNDEVGETLNVEVLEAIADWLGCSPGDLLEWRNLKDL
jgi:DNA-binding Xre family transcriptional regulator